jgi:alpha-glucosidase
MRYYLILIILFCIKKSDAAQNILMQSPKKQVSASIYSQNGQLKYSVSAGKSILINPSILGLNIDDNNLGTAVLNIKLINKSLINEVYESRGKHAKAINRCIIYELEITKRDLKYNIEFKLFDDGCAFRYSLKTEKKIHLVKNEFTTFTLNPKSRVWYFERNNFWKLKSYAGLWQSTLIDSLPFVSSQGPIQGKPLIVEQNNGEYLMLTEAALYNYSGLRFKAIGNRELQVDFTEGNDGFLVNDSIVTPWRVIGYSKNLNQLVNNDIITNLNPAPDKELFLDTEYIKPGRSVWSWITQHKNDNYMLPSFEKKYIDEAHKLGFEYTLIDEGWETKWLDKWNQLKDLCNYGANKNVGIWIWKHSKNIRNPEGRDSFLDSVKLAGAVGVKTDFMNSEAKELIDFEIDFLKACAKRKLLVNFHGCHTSTGESRTYPNEITREAVRGMELNIMNEMIPAWHNAALPFTRFLTGHGDYTPGFFSNKGNTTNAHQLAMFYLFDSSFQCLADNPENLSDIKLKPAFNMLKSLPVTWDETIVLKNSKIGVLAALARRKGEIWYVAVINGTYNNYEFNVEFEFLKKNLKYSATIVSDDLNESLKDETLVIDKTDKSLFKLLPTGGLLIKIVPIK